MIGHTRELKPFEAFDSGGVTEFHLDNVHIYRITTYCPDYFGPGPVHAYLVRSDGLLLWDAGIDTGLAREFFFTWRNQRIPEAVKKLPDDWGYRQLLTGIDLAGHTPKDIERLVLSHGHPDHFFMAARVSAAGGFPVTMHALDTPWVCNPWAILCGWTARVSQVAVTGMPAPWSTSPEVREQIFPRLNSRALGIEVHIDNPILWDGPLSLGGRDRPDMMVELLPGHSAGSMGLFIETGVGKVLLCGDTVLDPITPNPEDLLAYLQTLRKLSFERDIVLTLPAHGRPIYDLQGRIREIEARHETRLRMTYEACAEPTPAWSIAVMDGYFDTTVDPRKFNLLAGREVIVHLDLLETAGALTRTGRKGGVDYFRNTGEAFDSVYERIRELIADGAPAGGILNA